MNYDSSETERAVVLHVKWCERNGYRPDQPCSARSHRDGDTVVLKNVRGVLGCYRIGKTGRLNRTDWPGEQALRRGAGR